MKKMLLVGLFIVLSLFICPTHASALTFSDGVYFGVAQSNNNAVSDFTNDYNQEQSCDSILGDPNDENSVAWLLNKILTYTTIVGMILVVVLSSIDFLKVIVNSSDDDMAKAAKKLALRLIFAAFLFFVPTLTAAGLDIFNLTSDCSVIQQG